MSKNSFQRLCISFLLIISIVMCSVISAFAYHPVIEINSADWNIVSDDTYSAVYPNMIDSNYIPNPDFYSYSDLNGQTYYGSRLWDDDYPYVDAVAVNIPSFPDNDSDPAFGESIEYFDKVVFRIGETLYLACLYSYEKVYLNNQNYFLVNVDGYMGVVVYYEFTYPFSEWQFHSFVDYYNDAETVDFIAGVEAHQSCEIVWSDVDVYSADMLTVLHKADDVPFEGTSYTLEYGTPISVLSGSLSFTVSSAEVSRLSFGSFAFLMNDIGFICGGDASILNYTFILSIHQNGEFKGSKEFLTYSYDSRIDDPITVGNNYVNSYFEVLDFNGDMSQELEFVFSYTFVSDDFHLYFPGSIQLVEFESYENDMEHDEVMSAIDEASAYLAGEISSVKSELGKEITDAASDVVSASNSNTQILSDKIDTSTQTLSDKLGEVKDGITNKLTEVKDGISNKLTEVKDGITNKLTEVKDGISNKLTEIKNDLLEGIKSFFIPSDAAMEEIDNKWDELLSSRFGALYEVSDIITEFANKIKDTEGKKDTISLPQVKVKLVDTDFVFGGYEVKVIPEGFDLLVTTLKGIISIVCTLLFVNALRKKYDKLVGGNSV